MTKEQLVELYSTFSYYLKEYEKVQSVKSGPNYWKWTDAQRLSFDLDEEIIKRKMYKATKKFEDARDEYLDKECPVDQNYSSFSSMNWYKQYLNSMKSFK